MSFCYQPLNPRTDFCMTYLNEDQLLPSESGVHHFLFLYRQSNAVGGLTRERRSHLRGSTDVSAAPPTSNSINSRLHHLFMTF